MIERIVAVIDGGIKSVKKKIDISSGSVSFHSAKEYNNNNETIETVYEEMRSLFQHAAGKGDDVMDNALNMILDRLQQDAREREERYHNDAREREQRYRNEMTEQESIIRQDAKEREERIINAINDLKSEVKEREERTLNALVEIKNDFKSELSDIKDDVRSSRNTLITLSITTILGIAAMVVTLIITLSNFPSSPS